MIDTDFRLCKPVQSGSFAFMCDAGWSLRRAGGGATQAGACAERGISICNAKKTADVFIISGMTRFRITNAYIHDCRIANSAGRRIHPVLSVSFLLFRQRKFTLHLAVWKDKSTFGR
jgi:hypothetical protein